jgi:hypothetical protein
MWKDPIVAEVRNARAELAAEFNNDLHALLEQMRKEEKVSGHPVVSPPRRQKAK